MLPALPIVIPFIAAALCLILRRNPLVARLLSLCAAAALLGSAVFLLNQVAGSGTQTLFVGGWKPPFAIVLIADRLSALLLVASSLVALAITASWFGAPARSEDAAIEQSLFQLMLCGVCAAFLAGDIFNLFVWFEVLLVASFALLAPARNRAGLEALARYMLPNLLGSFLLLSGTALLYAIFGTLHLGDIAKHAAQAADHPALLPTAGLLITAFALKAASFPFFFWLPAPYGRADFPIAAAFAALLTKVAVYGVIRVTLILYSPKLGQVLEPMLVGIAALTALGGVAAALSAEKVRHRLSLLLVGHIGLALLGLSLLTAEGVSAAIFYLLHEMLVIPALFLASDLFFNVADESQYGPSASSRRLPRLLFGAAALIMAGAPPFSGFIGELLLLQACLEKSRFFLMAVIAAAAIGTLYTLSRIWVDDVWTAPADALRSQGKSQPRLALLAVTVLVALLLLAAAAAEQITGFTRQAAEELLSRRGYIEESLYGS